MKELNLINFFVDLNPSKLIILINPFTKFSVDSLSSIKKFVFDNIFKCLIIVLIQYLTLDKIKVSLLVLSKLCFD